MSEEFDPYRKWLGIAPHEQPPHHYRLLGIAPFEDDPDVIENAADRQMAHVRTYQSGRYRDFSQKILNELSAAKIMLLDPARKAEYDAELHDVLFGQTAPEPEAEEPPRSMPPVAAPPARREPVMPQAPTPRSTPMGQAVSVAAASAPMVSVGSKSRGGAAGTRARTRKKSSFVPIVIGLVAVGALLVGMLVFIVAQSGDEEPAVKSPGTKDVASSAKSAAPPPRKKATKSTRADEPNERITTGVTPREKPATSPSGSVDVPREQKFQLALVAARDALGRRDLKIASAALDDAEFAKSGAADEGDIQHLRNLYAHLEEFWRAVRAGLYERMQPGDVFEFGGETVELVTREGEEVTLKFNNDDHATKIADLPSPMAALLARKGLNMKEPRSLLCIAAFWTLDSKATKRNVAQERAKALWVEAAERGVKDASVARELGLDEAFVNSIQKKTDSEEPLPRITTGDKPAEPTGDKPTVEPARIVKQPVPNMEQLREAKQLFASKYGDDLARVRKTPAEYETFMTRLEEEAASEKNNALQYLMYEEACDAAASVLRHDALMKLVDEMEQRWEIDALRTKQLLLLKARPINSPATENFADTAAELAKQAEEAGRLDVAIAAANYSLRVGDKVKGRDQKELLRRVRDWEALADAAEKAQAGEAALAKDASDADAHLQVGRYLSYFKREWPTGLGHLAQSDSEDEKAAAKEDLANPTEPLTQFAVAERWYMLSKRKSGTARQSVLERAKHWFDMALPGLDEATRATAESRLRDIAKDLAPITAAPPPPPAE